eukprot:4033926-Karenia_brevis.AAC.1
MFSINEPEKKVKDACLVCDTRKGTVECPCCPEPIMVCGSCCLLRHVEGRYEKHRPDESSEAFEQFFSLKDDPFYNAMEAEQADGAKLPRKAEDTL